MMQRPSAAAMNLKRATASSWHYYPKIGKIDWVRFCFLHTGFFSAKRSGAFLSLKSEGLILLVEPVGFLVPSYFVLKTCVTWSHVSPFYFKIRDHTLFCEKIAGARAFLQNNPVYISKLEYYALQSKKVSF